MLKRLELVGFKSFADKTRFDFSPGITGVVGPNGSGKSNVVDAVRWILGEQSAKSLRGGEMADVIFNGSSSRKSLGLAEVNVTFDNTRKLLAVDADEVQITRRVYRDGTGEYLINGQMSRLKDIKEIFLGSGAGAGGYTIIAQGRVDELLQASTKDRREIFDEAAGISRFKAKKYETLRKLATVEGNLTRSKDRLDSLDAQLRTLRMQAAKAQKHREYSERLRELRVTLGLKEYHQLSATLETEQVVLSALKAEVAGAVARTEELEQAARSLDWEVGKAEESLRHQEAKLAEARQHIAGFEATLKHERSSSEGHNTEALRLGRLRAEVGYRIKSLEAESARALAEANTADALAQSEKERADEAARELGIAAARAATLDRQFQADQAKQLDFVQRAATARSQADAALVQVERLQKEYTRKRSEIEQKTAQRNQLAAALDGLSQADADLQSRLGAARQRLALNATERDTLRAEHERVQQHLAALQVRQGDLRGRIEVLEELERTQEGLGAGVRDVLAMREAADESSPLRTSILGLIADVLGVPHDVASTVELALGEMAQRFVVSDAALIDAVAAGIGEVAGRVGFVPLVPTPSESSTSFATLSERVTCENPALAALPRQLLGNVVLVESLAEARQLAVSHPGWRFVTQNGDLLEPDGTLSIGPLKAEAGIVSRKSELRELREQFHTLTRNVAATDLQLTDLKRRLDAINSVIEGIESEIALLGSEAGDLLQRIARQRQQVEQLAELVELLQSESRILEEEVQGSEAAWVRAKQDADEASIAAEALSERIRETREAIHVAEHERERLQSANTDAQVSLSRATAERDRARDRASQVDGELRKRKIEAIDHQSNHASARKRFAESLLVMLRASAGMAEAYAAKEARERQVAGFSVQSSEARAARETVREELHALRSGWQEKQEEAHTRELAVHDLSAKRDAIASRIREDYGLELAELPVEEGASTEEEATENSPPPLAPLAAQQEIEELRKKLARLGSVNMEALDELTRVETEFDALKGQHEDLAAARKSLEEVIEAINIDSRKLFTDTLNAVRGYFQELFRKLFAGGQADIVLEDPNDVLECGIEITARPPGKELRSLSLLSGGERTLTAIALLLAIFRNRPSPFCILDEVDAALDEANTARLASVLREFLELSQFIVVTHKKRTMAAADRLWGVTMQESGISRLLPMRFEDWPEDEVGREAA